MGHRDSLQSAKQNIDEVLQDLPGSSSKVSAGKQLKSTQSLLEKAKDNIAYVLGLPAALTGAFGFLWDSSSDEAALQ